MINFSGVVAMFDVIVWGLLIYMGLRGILLLIKILNRKIREENEKVKK